MTDNTFKLLFIPMLSILFGCSSAPKEKDGRSFTSIPPGRSIVNNIVTPSDSDVVWINIIDGKGSVRTRKKPDQTIYFKFSTEGYEGMKAHLSSPDSMANVRFSQIFMPDGTMDGPFGRDMKYNLPMEGQYKISVHENTMAGDPWAGIVKVNIELTK
ncbi:MAG: hypothetical protein LBV43_09285 [Prevotella sp.]|jgi:hypothetical protein|nr:hypothetical protein [Prevotella sp.]